MQANDKTRASPDVAIIGATGYTGKLIAAAARESDLDVVLMARSVEKLKPLARQLDYPCRAVSLDAADDLEESLQNIDLVINAAGPYSATARPVVEACLASGTHYIDVTGEIPTFQALHGLDQVATERGIMLMPGAGFAVVASDCLIAHTIMRQPDTHTLKIGISRSDLFSRGSAKTMLELFDCGVSIRRDGCLRKIPIASLEHQFDFGAGSRSALAVSWPDVFTAYHTTNVPNIETYFEVGPMERMTALYGRYSGWTLRLPMAQQMMKFQTSFLPEGPSRRTRQAHSRTVTVEAASSTGETVRSQVITPEAYSFTALSAVAIAKKITAGEFKAGFQTPASVYGPQLLSTIAGVKLNELP